MTAKEVMNADVATRAPESGLNSVVETIRTIVGSYLWSTATAPSMAS